MAEKTEKATPKKLRDARKKGQVAKAQDFPSAITFIVSISMMVILSGFLFRQLSEYMIHIFKSVTPDLNLKESAGSFLIQAFLVIGTCSLPLLLLTAMAGIITSFLVVGPVFSGEAVKPDLKRLNPVTNIKNIFKLKTLVELIKSVLKIAGASLIIYMTIWDALPSIIATAALPLIGTAEVFSSFLIKVAIRVGIFFLIVAIFDLMFQKRNFMKEMRMEKFEVRQEYRDTEGDPYLKGRRREVAREIAYEEGVRGVRRAKAIITNPIHIAIAVEYNEESEPAPRIATMGKGPIADLIMKEATSLGIPIMRNVPLAQTLFEKGKISEYIPEETYQAVAEILRWLESIEAPGSEIFKT